MQAVRELEDDPLAPTKPDHEPALLRECLTWLAPRRGGTYVDGTLGGGGHAEALLDAVGPEGRVFGIDRDSAALALASRRLARFGGRFTALRGDHEDLRQLLASQRVFVIDGLLLDLGLSSMQLDDPTRGFAFRFDGPLDMRMAQDGGGPTAADLLARASRKELERLFAEWGEERRARAIAREIERARGAEPIVGTRQLVELVLRAVGRATAGERIHPATRAFQALRIAVNHEIVGLETLVYSAVALLRRGGRIVVVSYHSLEDRAIKNAFRALARRCTCPRGLPTCVCGKENLARVLTAKPIRPTEREVARNPRARSARLRAAERL